MSFLNKVLLSKISFIYGNYFFQIQNSKHEINFAVNISIFKSKLQFLNVKIKIHSIKTKNFRESKLKELRKYNH